MNGSGTSERLERTRGKAPSNKGIAALEPEEFSTNDEGTHTWFVGEQKLSARWVGRIFRQETIEEEMDIGK